jgi:allantoinase
MDHALNLIIHAKQVLTNNQIVPATIFVHNGKIQAILPYSPEIVSNSLAKTQIINVDPKCVVMPGVVDSHVHVNEPGNFLFFTIIDSNSIGRTEWEGFATATKSAARGGVTTLADMPLNSIPPTTTVKNLLTKLNAGATCYT